MRRTHPAALALPAALAACALALVPATASAENKCKLSRLAELPVTMSGMRAMITLKVNGADAPFVLDTGAWYSMVTPAAAARLKMKIDIEGKVRMVGVGGMALAGVGTAKEVNFGGATVRNIQFLVGGGQFGGDGSVGLLGQNFLQRYDVEYDLANGVVRLFIAKDCGKVNIGYWAPGAANVMSKEPAEETDPHIIARAVLNGRKIKVLFDTGATTTILEQDAADKAGVPRTEGVEAGGVTGGIGKGLVETWVAPIANLDLGDEQIKRTHLRVGKLNLEGSDMLMGMDFFLSHHILVSNSQNNIYFTYNGGPVFNIGRAGAKPVRPVTAAAGSDDKMTAAELSRRAAASMARRDAPAAVSDLTRAVKLEPENAGYLSTRAMAHLMAGDLKESRDDLDAALKIKPDDVASLRARGFLLLGLGKVSAAEADFDAAAKAAPDDEGLRVAFAAAYEHADRRDLAVREYDRWLAEHPRSEHAWSVLNSRCWVRAMWNRDLDQALADCDAAVKKGSHNSMVLDSRGMVQLRLGHYQQAVADYDGALNKQSRSAWSYLGRGLAKDRLGDAAGAQADIKRALALKPDIADEARQVGLDSPLLPKGDANAGKTAKTAAAG